MDIIEKQRQRYDEKFKPDESFTDLNEAYEATRSKRDPDLIKSTTESFANKNINPAAIPDNEDGSQENQYNILQDTALTGYNAAKIVAEEVMLPLPLFERTLGMNAYSDEGAKYSGIKDFFSTLRSSELEGVDFVPIAKNQRDKEFLNAIESYKNDYVLSSDKIIDHLNKTLNTDVANVQEFAAKYKDNAEMAEAASAEIKKLEDIYQEEGNLIGSDFWEDDNYYYIKNFREMPWQTNTAWTKYGDLQIPGLGVYKIDDSGQGAMIANSPMNLQGSGRVGGSGDEFEYLNRGSIGSWLADQGFGWNRENQDFNLYGDPESKLAGTVASFPLAGFGYNPKAYSEVMKAPSKLSGIGKFLQTSFFDIPSKKGAATVGGITALPAASYYGLFDE
tara:strand:- start:1346 stop:2518 length:1173 start_codon:yes stop_codon:yes gene_type:complete